MTQCFLLDHYLYWIEDMIPFDTKSLFNIKADVNQSVLMYIGQKVIGHIQAREDALTQSI